MRCALVLLALLLTGGAATSQDRHPRGYRPRDRVVIRPHGADIYRRDYAPPRPRRAPYPYYWGHRTYARPYLGPYPYRQHRYGAPWVYPYRAYPYRHPYGPHKPWAHPRRWR